jgi:hypothetical protein
MSRTLVIAAVGADAIALYDDQIGFQSGLSACRVGRIRVILVARVPMHASAARQKAELIAGVMITRPTSVVGAVVEEAPHPPATG